MSKVILLTGPSGAGKTSIAGSFLQNQSSEWAYINQDDIRQLVKPGYQTADGLRSSWSDAVRNQWAASIEVCIEIAKKYVVYGISSLIDAYIVPEEYDSAWVPSLEDMQAELFILLPNLETAIKRNSLRQIPAKLTNDKIREAYTDMESWKARGAGLLIDNSNMSIDEVVSVLSNTKL